MEENTTFNEQDVRTYYKFLEHMNSTEVLTFEPKISWVSNEDEFVQEVRKYNQTEKQDTYSGWRDRLDKNDEGVTSSSGIFLEIDEHDCDKPLELPKIRKFCSVNNIKIGLIGFSGGGYHIYIPHDKSDLTDKAFKEKYRKALTNVRTILLKNNIDIDKKVFDLQRVTRVLGTYNWKRGKLSKIIEFNDLTYDEKVQNRENLAKLSEKYGLLSQNNSDIEISQDVVEILDRYKINTKEPWLYDLITKDEVIKPDTGGNSVFYKNSAIVLVREGLNSEEMRVVAKAICDKVKDRPLSAFYGWIDKAQRNELAQVNRREINNAIETHGYKLSTYTYADATEQSIDEAEPLKVMTILDYKKHKTDKSYLIKGIKFPKENEIVFAPSRSFKSLTTQYQACCIASGRKYLGYKTRKSPVLYISAENSVERDKENIIKILRGMKVRSNRIPLYFLPRSECGDLLDPNFTAKVCKTIETFKIKMLILDTANPLTPSIDENSAKDVTRLYNEFLKPLCDKYGVNITMLHHTDKKGDNYLGSMKWLGNSDVAWRYDRKDLSPIVTMYNEKCRRGESETLNVELKFSEKEITFKLLSKGDPSVYSRKKKMSQQEFFIMKLNTLCTPEMERKEIQETFKDNGIKFSAPTLDRALKEWRGNKETDQIEKDLEGSKDE